MWVHPAREKSTLLHTLGTLDAPSEGDVWIEDALVSAMSASQQATLRNQTLGFVYQFHHLLADFTALEKRDDAFADQQNPS